MKERSYRLAQYEIILDTHGGIWWKSHGGFADTKSGRCFIEGNVLFLSPSEEIEPGFLKNEWLQHLKQFPPWDKTKYYCPSYTLYACKSGRMQEAVRQPASTGFAGHDTAARPVDHSPLDSNPCPLEEREDRLHSFSPAREVEEKGGESEQLPAASPAMKFSEAIALTSISSSASLKHMTGKLGKAFRRCKGLVGLNSEKHESEE